jgi:sigma-B regulation protein RsbU (phosphoserine phosphatase)
MSHATISPEKRLFLKDRELGALLEITQAINLDYAEGALYKISSLRSWASSTSGGWCFT